MPSKTISTFTAPEPWLRELNDTAARLGATQVLVTWGGMWARRPDLSDALKAAYCTKHGQDVLVVPCGPDGYIDDHGRMYPCLGAAQFRGFKGKVRKLAGGKFTVESMEPWSGF